MLLFTPEDPFSSLAARALVATFLFCALGAGSALGQSPRPRAEAVPVGQFVRELEGSYHQVRSLQAHFVQIYHWGARTRRESGTVLLARGGRMRWDYRTPEPKLFLTDGKRATLYVPDEKQATVSSLKGSEDYRVPFRLLLSRLDLKKFFAKIEDAPGTPPAAPGDRVLRAFPKHGDRTGIHEVLMEMTPGFDVHRLVIVYSDHSRMEFTFSDIRRNVPWTPGRFRFQPPPGTQVIEQH